METKLNQEIRTVLKQFDNKYFIDGIVNKSKVIRDLDSYDADLVKEFLQNEELKKRFTMEIAGATIIKLTDLIDVFEQDEYWQDSYTKYSKKIGLTVNGKFLDETNEVVLVFPYKDTVLKASMSKEDNGRDELKPDEPFLNEIIAQDEIDTLLDKKSLVNVKRYTKEGSEETSTFNDDNLIIKGNNLLALYTLKERYEGRIKLVCIDPPYNTGNDAFNYNDKFSHSAWLTFIKNRLDIAKDLLHEEGSIWVTIDYTESAYLRVLMDEIFGRENFVSNIIWQNNKQSKGYKNQISLHHNEVIVYRKSEQFSIGLLPRTAKDNENYKNPDGDPRGAWRASDVRNSAWRPNLQYNIEAPDGTLIKHPDNGWRFSKETFEKELAEGKIKFSEDNKRVIRKIYLADQEGRVVESVWSTEESGSTREANSEIQTLFTKNVFATPKPEKLIYRIISIATGENDIVLDFFMGSATTQAVAMKMNRRFIGIEQMDYINTVSVPRLQKVIEGEQGGISKEVNWQGGGSFVYAELMEKNTGFIKEIVNAKNMTDLQAIFKRMMETADFDFRVDLEELQKEDLWQQSIDDQKRLLIKVIDKNQLYYNYSEIDDEKVRDLISDSDYEFNKSFYADRGE
ncbi:site-specific DNA-methyltransferase [Enterococcus faecalis]|uniref:site-specific DNA-methyltransferase n=1 Tax=Enterococcus faecalis TaxID=1351 RepID=UPI0010BD5C8C|nr:site-specific DNA-methyltransferase [Enterococcus faecalis]MCL4906413.1 site-specific DNA-methyltransferase [Enterococcus faecalis]MCV3159026.1 site-specific DNA-methyltransferase [Enterococcus faecalis]MCV3164192.1 site-specific DNA-methyltransferase [Enterococcus faecalis]MDJ9039349.1 site-specific DNA-methyltransferase [Enterococcus faecalis]MDK0491618.1 site-specific DNA-methyltransferase [Enterococcus faecalis]